MVHDGPSYKIYIGIHFSHGVKASHHISDVMGLECFQCGIYVPYEEESPRLTFGSGPKDQYSPTIDVLSKGSKVPTCNEFNASLPIFRVTCKEHEKGCLKGWLTQVRNNIP